MERENYFYLLSIMTFLSLIFGGLHLFFFVKLKENYSPLIINPGVNSIIVDETIAYAPKVQEIIEGKWFLTDVYLKEWKKLPSPLIGENLAAILIGLLGKLTHGVEEAFILADFLFPALNFLILSFFIFLLSQNWPWAVFSSLLTLFFSSFLKFFPYLPSILLMIIKQLFSGGLSEFYRSFHPQVSFPIFIGFCLFFYLGLKRNQLRYWLAAGFLAGSLAYTYFYYFLFASALTGVYLFWLILFKKTKKLKSAWFFLTVFLLTLLPFFLNSFTFSKLPQAKDYFVNFQYSPSLSLRAVGLCLFSLLLSLFLNKKTNRLFFSLSFFSIFLILISSYLLKININNIPDHLTLRVTAPFSLMAGLVLFSQVFSFVKNKKLLLWFFSFLLIIFAGFSHSRYFSKNYQLFAQPKTEKEMFNWLNQKIPKESVVVTASLKYNLLIPALTHNNVFLPYSQYSLASEKEAFKRFYLVYKFLGIETQKIEEMFTQSPLNKAAASDHYINYDECGGGFFYYCRYKGGHNYLCAVPPKRLQEIISEYEKFNPQKPFANFEADYFLFGPYEKKWAKINLKSYPFLKLIAQNRDFQLYQIKY